MTKIITKNDLTGLLSELALKKRVIAPIKKAGSPAQSQTVFAALLPDSEIDFSYSNTTLPPKEFLLPPNEVLFSFEGDKASPQAAEGQILFGLSYEDLEGVSFLSQIFERPISDEPYKKRRENTILIGLDRFSPPKNISYDLYLMRLDSNTFAGFAGSKEGQAILKNRLFKNQALRVPSVKKKRDELIWSPETWRAVEKSKESKIWDELAEICFGCGICSFTCPLCYCFETEDTIEFAPDKKKCGKRCRSWDSCMLTHFAETNAGNFRPELRDRIYNWYFHKFVRMPAEYGFPGCVDCMRCVAACPAKINFRKTLERVTAEYKQKGGK